METACTTPPPPPSAATPPVERPPQPIVHWILGVSLLLGIAADGLLRCLPLGINVALFVGLLSLVLAWGWHRHKEQAPCWHVLAPIFLLALCIAWRDSPVLNGLNLLAIVMLLVLLIARPTRHSLHTTTLAALCGNMFCHAVQAAAAPVSLLGLDTDWQQASQFVRTNNTRRILRGLAVAVPLLVVFTLLFNAADAVFKHMVETTGDRVFDLVIDNQYFEHILLSMIFSFVAACIIRPVTLGKQWEPIELAPSPSWRPGTIELSIAMGSVLILFVTFIVIQFRCLFGGDELVQTIPGLTYATYARKGFFALLCVVFVVHLLLTLGAWLVQEMDERTQQLYRGLGLALVALTTFIFASAFFRMYLYVEAYGLTRLRFYAVAILLWLAVVFLILVARLLRPGATFFTSGALYSLLALLLLLNAANPDGLIARVNLHRLTQGKELDLEYLQQLSTDAVPTILRYENRLSAETLDDLVSYILINRPVEADSWRNWNLSRTRARRQMPNVIAIKRLMED